MPKTKFYAKYSIGGMLEITQYVNYSMEQLLEITQDANKSTGGML